MPATMPEDLDELLALVEQQRRQFEVAVADTEKELAAGRTGHGAYLKARLIEADYCKLLDHAQARIVEALAQL